MFQFRVLQGDFGGDETGALRAGHRQSGKQSQAGKKETAHQTGHIQLAETATSRTKRSHNQGFSLLAAYDYISGRQ